MGSTFVITKCGARETLDFCLDGPTSHEHQSPPAWFLIDRVTPRHCDYWDYFSDRRAKSTSLQAGRERGLGTLFCANYHER